MTEKLLFHEGGQPVFLDDLKLMQDNCHLLAERLFAALGGGADVFLLRSPEATMTDYHEDTGTTFAITAGTVCVKGDIYETPATEVTVATWNAPLYLCVKRQNADERIFEDGGSHPCREQGEAFIATSPAGADEHYAFFDLKTLDGLLSARLGRPASSAAYENIPVTFRNGYSGTVQMRQLDDGIRVKVDIKSTAGEWADGRFELFAYDNWNHASVVERRYSTMFGTGGDDVSFPAVLQHVEGRAYIHFMNEAAEGSDTVYPANCPVSLLFDIPTK